MPDKAARKSLNFEARIEEIGRRAHAIRRHALRMAEVQGQGYVGQALGIADVLAVAYFHALNYRPEDPGWEARDRFLLSVGHYSIALYAALIEAGVLPPDEWETYGADDSRLPMSGMSSYTPGMEITGGSLGQGMSVAVGICLGLKRKTSRSFVYNLMSDGEINEGATWEAALSASHWRLDNLIVLVDVNNQQADGASQSVMQIEPLEEKWKAFGWFAQRVDGNDIEALVVAFDRARDFAEARPRVIVCDTLMGKGVPLLEKREKTHFIRVEPEEWRIAIDQLTEESGSNAVPPDARGRSTEIAPRLTTSAMIASIAAEGQRTRQAPFGHALAALAADRPAIVGLTADLGKYTDLHVFAAAYPDRFYQMGMAEQLLMGAAAGMARAGFIPFATTYAVFASRRAYDFICLAIAEDRLNVKIVCALPGLTTGYGPSHQATDDLAIFRAMPNLTIIDPCDAVDIEGATAAIATYEGPVYMRLLRGAVPLVLDQYDYKFELGRAHLLRDGSDVLIVASGIMTMRALEAAELLRADRVDAAVLHVPTVKPLDEDAIVSFAAHAGRLVVVAENHSVVGGLGEAVAGLLMRAGVRSPFRQIGLPDAFLDAGALPTLHERYGLSAAAVAERVKSWL